MKDVPTMSTPASADKHDPTPLRILIVEDRETDMELIVRELKKHGFDPTWVRVDTEEDFLAQIHHPFDLITADAIMPQFSALRAVTLLREHHLDIPCIVISGSIGEEEAVALIRAGASDYLMKDRLGRLGQAIRHVLDQRRLREEHRQAHKALVTLNEELERRIAERTAKLEEVNRRLAQELSERKLIERRLRQHEATLEVRVRERTKQLQQSHGRLSRLATALTLTEQRERKQLASELHDYLAQLLVVSKIKIAQLRRGSPPTETSRLLEETESALDQALVYSKTLVARLSPPVLFTRGLVAAIHWLTDYFSQHGLLVHVRSQVDSVQLPEDHTVLLFQSVRELLFNVLKHAGTNEATVEIGVIDQSRLRIIITDQGSGFDVAAAGGGEATGFGLFSIQERIEGLGGTFSVHSSPGTGSTIEISVLLNTITAVPDRTDHEPGIDQGVSRESSRPKTCRALIVDDHALIRQELITLLTTVKGVTVIGQASTGPQGVELAETLRPDLILMDVNMPGFDGIEATKRILAHNPTAKVVGVTINTDADVHAQMMAAGAVASLTKDTLPSELEPTLSRILNRRRSTTSSLLPHEP